MTDSHKTVQYNLRISEELRERLKQSAEEHNRSMNADIVARIEQTFQQVHDTYSTQSEILQALAEVKDELKAEIQSLKK